MLFCSLIYYLVLQQDFLASVFIIISNKSSIKSLQNKNKILSDELNDLRNVAIDEGVYEKIEEEDY